MRNLHSLILNNITKGSIAYIVDRLNDQVQSPPPFLRPKPTVTSVVLFLMTLPVQILKDSIQNAPTLLIRDDAYDQYYVNVAFDWIVNHADSEQLSELFAMRLKGESTISLDIYALACMKEIPPELGLDSLKKNVGDVLDDASTRPNVSPSVIWQWEAESRPQPYWWDQYGGFGGYVPINTYTSDNTIWDTSSVSGTTVSGQTYA